MWFNKKIFYSILISTPVFILLPVRADLTKITFNKDTSPPITRSVFDKKTNSKKTTNVLERIQEAIWEKNYSKCATLIAQARSRYKAIAPWISLTELECLSQLKGKAEDAKRLQAAIQRVEREKDWFLLGPYSD